MYNAEQKEAFLKNQNLADSSMNSLRRRFNNAEPYETAIQKDLCEMTIEEARELFQARPMSEMTANTQTGALYGFRVYVDWCVEKGFAHQNVFREISYESLGGAKNSSGYFESPSDFADYLATFLAPVEDDTTDNIYRSILWLLYLGVPKRCVFSLRKKDIDFNSKKLTLPDKTVRPILTEAFDDLLTYYNQTVVHQKRRVWKELQLQDNDSFIRHCGTNKLTENTFMAWIRVHFANHPDYKPSPLKIYLSGCCYRVKIDTYSLGGDIQMWYSGLEFVDPQERAVKTYREWRQSLLDEARSRAVTIDKPVQTVTLEDALNVLSDEIAARPDASDRGEKLLKSLKNLLEE